MKHEDFKQHIAVVSLFERCIDNEAFLTQLHEYCTVKHFRANTAVIREGEEGTAMFIGISGSIEVNKTTRAGDVFTLIPSYSAAGASFGELSLIDNEKRSATVRTTSKSQFYKIEKKDFDSLCNRFPKEGILIIQKLARHVSGFLRETNENMISLFDALVDEVRFS